MLQNLILGLQKKVVFFFNEFCIFIRKSTGAQKKSIIFCQDVSIVTNLFCCKSNTYGISLSVKDDTLDLKPGFKQGLNLVFDEN